MPSSQHSYSVRHYGTYEIEVACESIATIVYFLKRRSTAWRNRPIPEFAINKILAIMQAPLKAATCERLIVVPAEFGPQAEIEYLGLVAGAGKRLPIKALKTRYFFLRETGHGEWGVDVTDHFVKSYQQQALHIQSRQNDVLAHLEAHLGALTPVLDDAAIAEALTSLLTSWSICATGRLGLDYVMHDLDLALRELREPLEVLIGDRPLRGDRLQRSIYRARQRVGVAQGKIEHLLREWHMPVTARWNDPIEVERELLATVIAPKNAGLLFQLAAIICKCTISVIDVLAGLEATLGKGPKTPDLFLPDTQTAPWDPAQALLELRRLCASFRMCGAHADPALPTDDASDPATLAREVDRVTDCIYEFAAALAMAYRMPGSTLAQQGNGPSSVVQKAILVTDMGNSTGRGIEVSHAQNVEWKNAGLNVVAQWGRAFGGSERWARDGDDVILVFDNANSALLCACMIQEHFAALRSTSVLRLSFHFRIGIDVYPLTHADGGNLLSSGIDIAKKVTKHNKDNDDVEGILDRIWVTPRCADFLSQPLAGLVREDQSSLFEVTERPEGRFYPSTADRQGILSAYFEILEATGVS